MVNFFQNRVVMEFNSTILGNHHSLGNNDCGNKDLINTSSLDGLSNTTLCQDFSLTTTDIVVAVSLCSILAIGGSLGNGLVLLVISRTTNLNNNCSVFIQNLAIADLLVTVVTIPLIISVITKGFVPICSWNGSLMLGAIVLGRCSATASLLILSSMSLDRYWAICHPIHHKVKMTSSKLRAVLVLIWLASLVVPIPEVVVPRQGRWSVVLKRVKNFGVACCYIAIVSSGIAIFVKVGCASLKIDDLHINAGGRQMHAEIRERNKKVAKTIALVVFVFSLCWLPVAIISTRYIEYNELHFWSALLGLANSALNPCIYFYRQKSYRHELKVALVAFFSVSS